MKLCYCMERDSKIHGANMGPTWVLSVPDGPHVGPMNLAIRGPILLLHIDTVINDDTLGVLYDIYMYS